VLRRLQKASIFLNPTKFQFRQSLINFLGHVIDNSGITPDPAKTEAIQKMSLTNLTELRRFVGMVNHLSKFSPNIAYLSRPLQELLSPQKAWIWTDAHSEAFRKVKANIASLRVLALYDAETKISADASAYSLEVVLFQLHETP